MSESEFWDTIAQKRIAAHASGSTIRELEWEGDDPEELFMLLALDAAGRAQAALDIGCGEGELTSRLAETAQRAAGIDISEIAIAEAARRRVRPNLSFAAGDARSMPFEDESFDLICSHRGPAADAGVLREIHRVMKSDGQLISLMRGESHRIETQEIFGRGAGWPPAAPVRFTIPDMLGKAGLALAFFAECYGIGYSPNLDAFAAYLGSTPLIPGFDPKQDAALLREVERKLTTSRGIRDTEHMAVFVAVKR